MLVDKNLSIRCESKENSSIKYLTINLCSSFQTKTAEALPVREYYGELLAGDGKCSDQNSNYCSPCLLAKKRN